MRENEAMRGCDENPLKGDYNLIYPNSNFDRQKKYDIFIEAAKQEWNSFTTGKSLRKKAPFVTEAE